MNGIVNGPSHAGGGVPALNTTTGQPLNVEGGEAVLTKKAMDSQAVITATGTPREVAGCMNAQVGGGENFSPAPCNMEVINQPPVMAGGGMIAVVNQDTPWNILFWMFKISC